MPRGPAFGFGEAPIEVAHASPMSLDRPGIHEAHLQYYYNRHSPRGTKRFSFHCLEFSCGQCFRDAQSQTAQLAQACSIARIVTLSGLDTFLRGSSGCVQNLKPFWRVLDPKQ